MPKPLRDIVQSMIDAGEPEEAIASVVQRHGELNPAPQAIAPNEPDTFGAGVMKSLTGNITDPNSVLNASAKGGLGFLKGAIADLPSSIGGMASDFASSVMHPLDTIKNIPYALGGIKDVGNSMMDTASRAGSDPMAFGEMMGQTTGQPLVTEGIIKGLPAAKPIAGRGLEIIGDTMNKHAPISGMVPKVAEPRILRTVERGIGRKVSELGRDMQVPVKNGEVELPEVKDGVYTSTRPTSKRLNPSTTTQYGKQGIKEPLRLGDGSVPQTTTINQPPPLRELDSRISGLAPEAAPEPPPPELRKVLSPTVNRINSPAANASFFDQMKMEAHRYGMSVTDYIQSLREGGADNFVMPSAEKPRVRTGTILK